MLTLRFEADSVTSDAGNITFIVETPSFRTSRMSDGSINVIIENEHGVGIYHVIASGIDHYDRCYVMNAAGQTVAQYAWANPVVENTEPPERR